MSASGARACSKRTRLGRRSLRRTRAGGGWVRFGPRARPLRRARNRHVLDVRQRSGTGRRSRMRRQKGKRLRLGHTVLLGRPKPVGKPPTRQQDGRRPDDPSTRTHRPVFAPSSEETFNVPTVAPCAVREAVLRTPDQENVHADSQPVHCEAGAPAPSAFNSFRKPCSRQVHKRPVARTYARFPARCSACVEFSRWARNVGETNREAPGREDGIGLGSRPSSTTGALSYALDRQEQLDPRGGTGLEAGTTPPVASAMPEVWHYAGVFYVRLLEPCGQSTRLLPTALAKRFLTEARRHRE